MAIDWNTHKEVLIDYLKNYSFNSPWETVMLKRITRFKNIAKKVNLEIIKTLHELIPSLKPEELEEFKVP